MTRLRISAAALTVLLLGACAAEPEAPVVAAPPEPVAEAQPPMVAEPTPAPMPEPLVAAPAESAKAEPPPLDKRTTVYLASYKTEASAMRGWKILAHASPVLAKQSPVTRPVDLGKKGKFVRLYAMAADEAERATICKQVGKHVDECGARNRE